MSHASPLRWAIGFGLLVASLAPAQSVPVDLSGYRAGPGVSVRHEGERSTSRGR